MSSYQRMTSYGRPTLLQNAETAACHMIFMIKELFSTAVCPTLKLTLNGGGYDDCETGFHEKQQ